MCTKNEAKEAIRGVLHEDNGDGTTFIGKEVNQHIDRRASTIVSSLTLRFGIGAAILVATATAAWVSMENRVSSLENQYDTNIDRRFNDMKEDIDEIKSDVKDLLKKP